MGIIVVRSIFSLIVISLALFSFSAIANEQTYVRDYTYAANILDTKESSRALALQEVKRTLLNEIGTHVNSIVRINESSNGTRLATEEVQTLTAGVTRLVILDEKWTGAEYYLKAQIKADPIEVLNSLNKLLDVDHKKKEILRLNGELIKIRKENINISESLVLVSRRIDIALAEIERLRNQLNNQQTDPDLQVLKTRYQIQVDTLTLNELNQMAMRYYIEYDYQNAFQLFKKLAEQGDVASQANIGWMYTNGEGVDRDVKKGEIWYQNAAEKGDVYAQTALGAMFIEGEDTIYNPAKAMYWFLKAAEQGHNIAQYNIGVLYDDGIGVVRDTKQTAYWYQKSAQQGFAAAQTSIGVMYFTGIGVVHDGKQATYWFQKAAEQGDVYAQSLLGNIYAQGEWIERDSKKAVYWFQKAAKSGEINAQKKLAMMYAKGDGVSMDKKVSMYWIRKAADQGDADAQAILQSMR